MMDTTETYIKMCEKAREIQELWQKLDGDDFYDKVSREVLRLVLTPESNMLAYIDVIPGDEYNEDGFQIIPETWWGNFTWLPRQDQLQEMVGFIFNSYDAHVPSLSSLSWFADWGYGSSIFAKQPGELFTPMEQLWLVFVMKECYGKVWNGKDWTE